MYQLLKRELAALGIEDINVPPGRDVWLELLNRLKDRDKRNEDDLVSQALFEQTNDAIFLLSLEGQHLRVNQKAAEMLGYRVEEALNLSFRDVVVPSEHDQSLAVRDALLAGEQIAPYERLFRRKDGTIFPVEINLQMIYDGEGNPFRIMSVVRDITDRKLAEKELRESEENLRHLVEHLQVGVVVHKPDTEIILVNKKALDMLGLTEDQMRGKTSFDPQWNVIHEDGSPFPPESHPVSIAIATGQAVHDVVMGVYRPHTWNRAWLLVDAMPEFDTDDVLQRVIVTFTDISTLKQVETALRESEGRYHDLFEGINDAVFVHDSEANILDVNEVACRQLGYTRDELLQMKTLQIDDPDYAAGFRERLAVQESQGTLNQIKGVHVARDGRRIDVEVNSRQIVYRGQKAILAVARDVTERRLHEQQAVELAVKTRAVETLQRLTSGVSHDLRTPLSVMRTTLYLIRRKLAEDSPELRELDILENQVNHLTRIVENVETLASLDKSHTIYHFIQLQLNEVVDAVVRRYEALIHAHQHSLQCDLKPGLPTIRGDPSWLEYVIRHLIINAINYTPNGGRIIINTDAHENGVVFRITDTGIGIAPEHLPHIFDQFYRADEARPADKGGTGLGLSIARQIVMAHGGHITVESTPDQGTTFGVWFPTQDHPPI